MKNLWLIQRGKFKKIDKENIEGIDSLLTFSYMGSAEFEFGALPHSLRRIIIEGNGQYGFIEIFKVKNKSKESAFVYCKLSEKEEIEEAVKHLSKNDYGYKEAALMASYIKNGEDSNSGYYDCNFWWDIENDFFVLFGEGKRELLQIAIDKMKEKWDVREQATDGKISLGNRIKSFIN